MQDIRKHMSIFNRQIQLTKSVFSHNKIIKLSKHGNNLSATNFDNDHEKSQKAIFSQKNHYDTQNIDISNRNGHSQKQFRFAIIYYFCGRNEHVS